jgi:hypothetical protein
MARSENASSAHKSYSQAIYKVDEHDLGMIITSWWVRNVTVTGSPVLLSRDNLFKVHSRRVLSRFISGTIKEFNSSHKTLTASAEIYSKVVLLRSEDKSNTPYVKIPGLE